MLGLALLIEPRFMLLLLVLLLPVLLLLFSPQAFVHRAMELPPLPPSCAQTEEEAVRGEGEKEGRLMQGRV